MSRTRMGDTDNPAISDASACDAYDPSRPHAIGICASTERLLQKASRVYDQHWPDRTAWYGRCIFLSWYCSLADCTFCFRATKSRNMDPRQALRSQASVALEALFCRVFCWRIEFLTGGYGMMEFPQLLEYARLVSSVYGERIWLNVGVLSRKQLELLQPYVKGICASIETATPALHKAVCPNKPIEPYEKMFRLMDEHFSEMKRSIAVIVGLDRQTGIEENEQDLYDFIDRNRLDRITVYALKPVRGTPFTIPPSTDKYVATLARLRIRYPGLQIIAGTNLRRCQEAGLLMRAGANAITKFPATKQFNTLLAKDVVRLIKEARGAFSSNLTTMPAVDWHDLIDRLPLDAQIKTQMKAKLPQYLHRFTHPTDRLPSSGCFEE